MLGVDDEPMVREIRAMILRLRGYRVSEAENGVEALALVTGFQNGTLDVLITDLCIQGMSGVDLAERVHEARPAIKAIMSAGETAARHLHAPSETCLTKLFKPGTTDQVIRAILEPASAMQ